MPQDTLTILQGDAVEQLRLLPDKSIHCCVTSPPYWGLRDYGIAGQLGLERSPEEYVAKLVGVFREVRRVLRDDGTLWLNLGDSYNAYNAYNGNRGKSKGANKNHLEIQPRLPSGHGLSASSLKPKDLVGVPWRVAFALQADGWYLRSEIIWHKPNPMPESVTDRPTKAHEQLFLLSKSERYFYDSKAIREKAVADHPAGNKSHKGLTAYLNGASEHRTKAGLVAFAQRTKAKWTQESPESNGHRMLANLAAARANGGSHDAPFGGLRNKRSVWTISPASYKGAHFATFPPKLIEPCILAGCPVGGTVLDPFAGSGTTGMVALDNARFATLIELNPAYVELIKQRCCVDATV